jgi:hypothetical protein
MPYMIVPKDGKFSVHKQNEDKSPGELMKTYDNEDEAKQYLKALYANVPDAKSIETMPPVEKPENGMEEPETGGLTVLDGATYTSDEIKDIVKRHFQSNVGGGTDRDSLPDSSFVFPEERTFPIVTAKDVKDAVSSFGRYKGKHSFDDFKSRLSSLAKRKGFDSALPEKWDEPSKSLKLDYVKSITNSLIVPDMAVKYVSRDMIRHPIFVWGDPQQLDVEQEYFNRNSDLWDKQYVDIKRPLTWDHAQDSEYKDENPIVGMTLEYEDDDVARWAVSKIERNRRYRKAIDKLIEEGALGTSSDSVPQYVVRQKKLDGKSYIKSGAGDWVCEEDGMSLKSVKPSATYLKRWPWVASALTDVPAEPRMNGSVEWFKSLGLAFPDVPNLEREEMELKARYFKIISNWR